MKKTILYAILILVTIACKPTESKELTSINAIVNGYDGNKASINLMGFFVDPMLAGTINNEGSVSINLPKDFTEITNQAFQNYNSSSDAVYELSPASVVDIFVPLEGVTIDQPSTSIALAGKYYGFELYESNNKVGIIFPSSSIEFMKYIMNPDKNKAVTGFYYMLIYSDGKVNIKGSNESPLQLDDNGLTNVNSTVNYDVELQKGWNIVKYTIDEMFKDRNNELQIQNSRFSTTNSSLNDLSWVYLKS